MTSSAKTKTPPELNRGGVIATVWLPVAQAQYFLTLQPILHVGRAHLLSFPVSADLAFLQGSSARCGDLFQPLTVYANNYTRRNSSREVPQKIFGVPPLRSPNVEQNEPLRYRNGDQAPGLAAPQAIRF